MAGATLAGWRWGERVAGWVAALPVVVGPVLLVYAVEHGLAFAADAAAATILGLVQVAVFTVVYARMARGHRWPVTLLVAWLACGATAALLQLVNIGPLPATLAALAALAAAWFLIGPAEAGATRSPAELAVRVLATAALVVVLTALAGSAGPRIGGVLLALPVLASILAAFAHHEDGGEAAAALMRGMAAGLTSFLAFCLVVALWLPDLGIAATFGLGVAAALLVEAATAQRR